MSDSEQLNKTTLIKAARKIGAIELFLPVFPILAQYGYGFSSIGIILMFAVTLGYLFVGRRLFINKWLLLFGFYMLLHQLLLMFFLDYVPSYMINSLIMSVTTLLMIFVLCSNLNEDGLYKVWKAVGLIVMMGLFYHAFFVYILGMNISVIRILPFPVEGTHLWQRGMLRPMSFFTEPAAYAAYMLPLLFLAFKKKELLFAIAITLSIFLSTSSTGILLSLFLWSYLIFSNKFKRKYKIMIIIILCSFIAAFFYLSVFDFALQKLLNTKFEDSLRLSVGYQIYAALPSFEKIVGIVAPNLKDYLLGDKLWFPWMQLYPERLIGYTNTASRVFIQYGFIGGFLYLLLFYKMFRWDDKSCRGYLLVIFLTMFGQSMFLGSMFLLQFIIYFGLCNKALYGKNYFKISLNQKGGK